MLICEEWVIVEAKLQRDQGYYITQSLKCRFGGARLAGCENSPAPSHMNSLGQVTSQCAHL